LENQSEAVDGAADPSYFGISYVLSFEGAKELWDIRAGDSKHLRPIGVSSGTIPKTAGGRDG